MRTLLTLIAGSRAGGSCCSDLCARSIAAYGNYDQLSSDFGGASVLTSLSQFKWCCRHCECAGDEAEDSCELHICGVVKAVYVCVTNQAEGSSKYDAKSDEEMLMAKERERARRTG